MFVVQRHHATNLHFDLRLEVGGVLVSWAVPKGPSLDPSVKRLAHRVGDHDLAHADVEGSGLGDGPGTVIVWDTGSYADLGDVDVATGLERGHVKVELHGHRLTGGFALTQTRMGGDEANWLLVKVDDEHADREHDPVATELTSVLSGRSNADLEHHH
ncbi:DNA ligase [Nocardioides mangrovicus]|uniref:DNA ligase n=1 Tax=Nocardioides mangrovicus TaxID=2478913 RepID=A0A3L8P0Z8_9ACTN|nr:DNA ligase [Nocardioides mangrovicus]